MNDGAAPFPNDDPSRKHQYLAIVIATDDSEHSERALRYAGTLLHKTCDVHVTLFHVLDPIPRKFLDHGGSENPSVEVHFAD